MAEVIDIEPHAGRRYAERVERRCGLSVVEVVELAIEAERNGATPAEVREILDGDLRWFERRGR